MLSRSTSRNIVLALFAMIGAVAWASAADAQGALIYPGWGHPGPGGYYDRNVFRHRPVRYRTVIAERPYVVYRPRRPRVVTVERPFRPVHLRRRIVVQHPHYAYRPWHPGYGRRPPWVERPWRERRRCFLPERYLCG